MLISSDRELLPDVVDRIASCEPSRVALVEEDRSLTYGCLNHRANQVAHYLQSIGAGAESRIGVAMGRSIEYVIAALGILKSGAAYVPLDPRYPAARRRAIAEDAGLQTVLVGCECEPAQQDWSATTVSVNSEAIRSQPTSEPATAASPDQLAYVIYTSGSTGASKGVEVTRANLRHLVEWHNAAFGVTEADRATLVANTGFDASVWELWPNLCAGATIAIPAAEMIRDPEALKDWLVQSKVTILFAPTLLAEVLMTSCWPADASLRFLLTGGDALRTTPALDLPFPVINNYGPAECTVVSTSGVVSVSETAKMPSIGRAIAGAEIVLLDADLKETPAGSPGEICIGGGGVARGYLNQPELTAQRFIVRNGARFYRSGDLGSRNEDGTIQFLGRMDEQVKVRGYRIECGEIEAALNSLRTVQTSAVALREQRGGHKGLTAFVAPKAGAQLNRDELREGLRALLPEYMLPEQFVHVEAIPITENGKIDRRNLPAIGDDMIVRSCSQPSTPVETELVTILSKLLKLDQIELNDDFFLMGGHSFAAAQLIARIRSHFGVELSLRAVFENPTPAEMAQQIEQRMAAKL